MGLLAALSNAVTGLNINQQNLNVLSQNISNANTPNYSKEVVNQQASFINGQGTGVSLDSITRTVDQFLTTEVQGQTSANSAASTVQSYYTQIENLLGQPGTTNSIDQTINSFFTSLQDLANSPSVSAETTVINSATALTSQISGLANSLQGLRLQADTSISSAVNKINADLQTLFTTNVALERASATNQPIGGLLDQRDAAVTDVAQYLDVNPIYQDDGEVTLNTSNGITLLTSTSTGQLSYSPATSAQSFINNSNLSPIQLITIDPNGKQIGNPVTLATGGTSASVTSSLVSGQIPALLSVRDSIIPNILSQLDQLAGNLRDSMNAISNQGVSFPPPNSYTGQRQVTASTTSQWSGDVQIALLDANGNPAPSPYSDETNGLQPLTLDLNSIVGSGGTGILSTNDVINAINQYYTPQNKVELGDINNVQLGMLSNTVPDSSSGTSAINFDFNLNNISANNAGFYVSGVTVLDSTGATVSSTGAGTVTSSQPSVAINSYTTTAGSDNVTLNLGGTSVTAGEYVYLNAPSSDPVNGIPASQLTGYFQVQSVNGSAVTITVPGAGAEASTGTTSGITSTLLPPYDNVASGDTTRTGSQGSITADVPSNGASPYYTVQANIASVDANGNLVQSTVSYTVLNNSSNVRNNLLGASQANGNAIVVAPNTTRPLVTATLVDANGNPLLKTNNSYGNQQGYLKITADNASYTLAINELDSKQLGLPNASPVQPGTNQGFSQYFGLNNFFNMNKPTTTGDTTANSATSLSVNKNLISNPALITTGTLTLGAQPVAGSASPPNFTYFVAAGDNSISQTLAGIGTQNQSFALSGGMPASSTTLSQYAGQIISKTSSDSSNATNTANDSQTLLTGFTQRAQSVSGVNLDQELANTVVYQNAYTASTRVITVVSTMFQELLGIIQ